MNHIVKNTTQKENILNHLKVYGTITPLEALDLYGSMRLGAVVFELKKEGHDIKMRLNPYGKHYAIYTMERSEP